MRHAVDRRQQVNLPVLTRFDGDRVAVIDKLKQRLQGVIAVSALSGNVEKQVQFCGRASGSSFNDPVVHFQLDTLATLRQLHIGRQRRLRLAVIRAVHHFPVLPP